MKELLTLTGGYRRVMDYLLNLQAENLTLGNALFASLGFDMVLQGCTVHDNGNGTVNIAAGIIYIGSEALRFDGANNVASNGSKTFVKGAYTTSNSETFGDGSIKNVYREAKAVIADATGGNVTQIKIKTTLYNLAQYIQDRVQGYEVKGAIKEVYDLDGTFLTNFDASGLGVTPRWVGWARDNGSNGTPGSVGMTTIAAGTYTDPSNGEQTVYIEGEPVGEPKHLLTVNETAKPAGLPQGLEGPHKKPGDGGGMDIFYVTGGLGDGFDADQRHNNMQPSMPVYRVVKIS